MKKVFILLFFSMILTGCTAEYNLEIKENSFKESVNIFFSKVEFTQKDIEGILSIRTPITQVQGEKRVYNASKYEDSYNYIINENYEHKKDTIDKSYLITRCYGANQIKETKDKIIVKTANEFMCIYMDDGAKLESAQINIKTKLKVLENNADKVNGNVYTWYINKNNYLDKPIYLEIQKSEKMSPFIQYFIMIFIIFFLALLGYYYFKIKNNSSNKF